MNYKQLTENERYWNDDKGGRLSPGSRGIQKGEPG